VSGYCDDCGNTLCVCDDIKREPPPCPFPDCELDHVPTTLDPVAPMEYKRALESLADLLDNLADAVRSAMREA
jgi:hypothetical protein